MSRKYKFHNQEGLYFVSFATVFWLDVFVREAYFLTVLESLRFCRERKGMRIYCYCIMPSHIHLIFRSEQGDPSGLLRDFKTFTSKELQRNIAENPTESRKEWLLWMMKHAAEEKRNVKTRQFWQHHNQPIELWSASVIDQKVDYIHMNPVQAGFVMEPQHWKYSSALDYSGGKGQLAIDWI